MLGSNETSCSFCPVLRIPIDLGSISASPLKYPTTFKPHVSKSTEKYRTFKCNPIIESQFKRCLDISILQMSSRIVKNVLTASKSSRVSWGIFRSVPAATWIKQSRGVLSVEKALHKSRRKKNPSKVLNNFRALACSESNQVIEPINVI